MDRDREPAKGRVVPILLPEVVIDVMPSLHTAVLAFLLQPHPEIFHDGHH